MITCKQLLNALNAFIQINIMEQQGVDYICRLAHAVKVMNLDETAFEVFTELFNNEKICTRMINWLE